MGGLKELNDQMEKIQKTVGGGVDDALKGVTDCVEDINDAVGDLGKTKGFDKFENKINAGKQAFDKLKNTVKNVGTSVKDTGTKIKTAATKLIEFGKIGLDKLKNSLKTVNTHLGNIAKKAAGATFTGLKKVASLSFKGLVTGLVAGSAAVVKFANLASDLEETKNKVDVAFGSGKGSFDGAAKDVMNWSKNSTTAMGLAQQTALDLASTYGDMGTSMGLTKQSAADMAMSLTQQAADIASFKNMSIDEVNTAMAAIYTGETESLKRMGVVMTQTNLEQYALTQGISKSLDEMTEAEKVQLRYSYVMEKTANATGDYARTGGGFANQLRTLTENFKQLGAIIGQLPMKKLASGMKVVNDALAEIQEILSDGFQSGDGDKIMKIIENLIDKGITALEKGLPVIMPKVVSFLNTIIESIVRVLPKIAPALASGVAQLMVGFAKAIFDNKEEILVAIKDIIVEVSKALYEGFTGKEMSGDLFAGLKERAEKVIPVLKKLAPAVIGVVAAFKGFKAITALTSMFGGKGGGGKGGFMNTFKELSKTKPAVILKGMANLAIIIGGVTILSAALMAVAPHIAKLSDGKSIAELLAVILAVGAVGTALSKMAEVVGKIPITTVLTGLANMAIMMVGIGAVTAALMWIAPKITALGDMKSILTIAALMTILGTVGTVLAIFAGIVGAIPIPVVLTGLANMALVIGGLTALIAAYGALSKIDGFDEIIKSGGETLATLFGIIGKIGGSLIGGLGEGISNALPAIGENLGKFGENIKPLFENVKGIDIGGVAAFFGSIVGLLGIATGNEIVEGIKKFFGGGESALSKLGTQLADFATNSKTFFTTVAELPEKGFSNATLMFDCLAGLKSLPKEGGVKGWFNGELNYANIASGLDSLADEKVSNFFASITDLKQAGFDNASKLFECLAGLKSLPKEGGVKGWFGGDLNYTSIADGLGALGSEKVAKFFAMAGGLNKNAFVNVKELFKSLAGMGDLEDGEKGFWGKLGDKILNEESKTTLQIIADDLGNFASKTKDFFNHVNSLKLGNLNGLWASLKSADTITNSVSEKVDENIKDIVKKISELPKQMGDGFKKSGKSLSEALVSVWKDAVNATVSPVNKLLSGANWILKQFGSEKTVEEWKPYAKGTDGHKGGNALVNDGRGAELVQMPNGRTFIPNGRNVFIPNAPQGMKVLSAERTAALFGKKSPTFRYADGVGDIDVWSYADNAKGLIGAVKKAFVNYDGMSGFAKSIGSSMVNTIADEMPKWAKKLYDEVGTLASYIPSKGVEQWRSTVARALKMEGQYSASNVTRTLFQMKTESGGNPKAINLWDSNAKKGIPSKGLMQVIDPTFNAYARDGYDKNIYDPLSNILASVRYATSRYGSLTKAYRGVGYSNGVGTVELPKQSMTLSYTPENRYTGGQTSVTEHNTFAPQFSITITGASNERDLARKVKRWVSEAMNETIESMERKSARLQEV